MLMKLPSRVAGTKEAQLANMFTATLKLSVIAV